MDEKDKLLQAQLAQLKLLQTRIGLHGNRMWQLPLTYLGLLVLAYSKTSGESAFFPDWAVYLALFIFGVVLLLCLWGAREGYTRTAENMISLEKELGLKVSTEYPWSHTIPYFVLLGTSTILSVTFSPVNPVGSNGGFKKAS